MRLRDQPGIHHPALAADPYQQLRKTFRSSSAEEVEMPTTIADEIRKMTTDPGARRLAQYLDQLKERLDVCCPPTPIPVPLKAESKEK
jgi:hypothetical protein